MTVVDPKDAIIRMYEDTSIIDDLQEEPSITLLKWGEGQLKMMANRADDADVFNEQTRDLRRIMKSVNLIAGRAPDLEDEQRRKAVRRLIERAQEMGYPPQFGSIGPIVDSMDKLDEHALVRALLALVETGDTHAPGGLKRSAPGSVMDTAKDVASQAMDKAQDALDALHQVTKDAQEHNEDQQDDANTGKRPPDIDDIPGANRK